MQLFLPPVLPGADEPVHDAGRRVPDLLPLGQLRAPGAEESRHPPRGARQQGPQAGAEGEGADGEVC